MKKLFATILLFPLATFGLSVVPVAAAPIELMVNGGFEEPIVGAPQLWDVYVTADIPGWNVEWMDPTPAVNKPADANAELHRGVLGPAAAGDQYAELDSDWDGPNGGINNEAASTRLYQDLPTQAGKKYTVHFQFSPRPNTSAAENVLHFLWDGSLVETITRAGSGSTDWSVHEYELTASGPTTRIAFEDHGTSNSLGTFLDDVSVTFEEEEDGCCDDPIVVVNKNTAVVGNHVSSSADTGDNYAGGSEGGNGGDAGDIENDGGVGVISGATTGNGGRGGDGGAGGMVVTGSATSGARAINVVNTNITRVGPDEGEQADCCPAGPVIASNRNRAIVFNDVEAKADTGDNAAKGSEGGNGGDSGDIENENEVENEGGQSGTIVNGTTGNGGQGGAGDAGGYIETGSAVSGSRALNVVNTNRLRVR